MKIIFVTQNEPFYIKHFFASFFKEINKVEIEVMGVIVQDTFNEKNKLKVFRRAMQLYGLLGFFLMGTKYTYNLLAEKIFIFFKISSAVSLRTILFNRGVEILPFKSVNSEEFIAYVRKNDIDLIISVAASEIFKRKILNIPKIVCLNIHGGKLPAYRGMMPNFWTLYNKEKCAWVTIHEMGEHLDDGRIVEQVCFPVEKEYSFNDLAVKSKQVAAKVLIKVLGLYEKKKVQYKKNCEKQKYYTFPSSNEIKIFKKRGGKVI